MKRRLAAVQPKAEPAFIFSLGWILGGVTHKVKLPAKDRESAWELWRKLNEGAEILIPVLDVEESTTALSMFVIVHV